MPGVSIFARPWSRFSRSNLATYPSPISVTYHADPSGSAITAWGLALAVKPAARRSTVAVIAPVRASSTMTEASFWLGT